MSTPNKPKEIAVDFDETLAVYSTWLGVENLGEPIPEMVKKIKAGLAAGDHFRIFSARVAIGHDYQSTMDATLSTIFIAQWCQKHLGIMLPVVCVKTRDIDEIWDDRAISVIPNTGVFLSELAGAAQEK